MSKFNRIVISFIINILSLCLYTHWTYAQNTDSKTNDYSDSLSKSCSYAQDNIKYISGQAERYFAKADSKQETFDKLNTLVKNWEATQISNPCFTIGHKISDCEFGTNKNKELLVADIMLDLTRNLIKDIENNKKNNIISKSLQTAKTKSQDVIKTNCP